MTPSSTPYHRSAAAFDLLLDEQPLSVERAFQCLCAPGVGGICLFVGTVRDHNQGRRVLRLEYEAQAPLALREMEAIAHRAVQDFGVHKMVLHHRLGSLEVGAIAVIIGVAAAHREAALRACQYGINALKERVPIWKKEYFEGGALWIADPASG